MANFPIIAAESQRPPPCLCNSSDNSTPCAAHRMPSNLMSPSMLHVCFSHGPHQSLLSNDACYSPHMRSKHHLRPGGRRRRCTCTVGAQHGVGGDRIAGKVTQVIERLDGQRRVGWCGRWRKGTHHCQITLSTLWARPLWASCRTPNELLKLGCC